MLSLVVPDAARMKADLVVIADGSLHPSGMPVVQMGVRGLLNFELHARGARQDVPNPAWTLVQLLATMKSPTGEITIDGLHDAVEPPTPEEVEAAQALPIDVPRVREQLGIPRLDGPESRGYFERLMFHPTLTINGLHSGYGGPGMKTIIPCEASVKCDMRLVGSQGTDQVFDRIVQHVARRAPEVEATRLNGMEPWKTPVTSPFTTKVMSVDRRTLNRRLEHDGESYSSILQRVRVDVACRVLHGSDCSMSQVADAAGFDSLSAFSRWFQRSFACTASEWRARQQGGARRRRGG